MTTSRDTKKDIVLAQQYLTDCQRWALQVVQARAKHAHKESLQSLHWQAARMRFPPNRSCLEYIAHQAPVVIHLNQNTRCVTS